MIASLRRIRFVAVVASCASCGPVDFHVVANGRAEEIVGMHGSHAVHGATRAVTICGEYPRSIFAMDTGGSVCLDMELDHALLGAANGPVTAAIDGETHIDEASTRSSFSGGQGNSPIVRSIVLAHRCLCANFTDQAFQGSITFARIESTRLAGTIDVTVSQRSRTSTRPYVETIHARFEVSGH